MPELTLTPALDANTLALAMTTSTAVVVGSSQIEAYDAVIWATTAFTFAIGKTPTAVKPVPGTPGDRSWPAGLPIRVRVPAGHQIAALALTGTGDLYVNMRA